MAIRVLVVDDSANLRRLLVGALEALGDVTCVEAADGGEALRRLREGSYDLMLTDINMPVLDGLKLVAHLRQSQLGATMPIVVITTESAAVDRARALALGASAYLVKPVRAQLVVDAVRRLLPGLEARAR